MQKLSPNYSFTIEPYKERLRLVVVKDEEDFVCRKENRKNLMAFLSSQSMKIFKGRLQLNKSEKTIEVQVKGETIGQINKADFQKLLADAQLRSR